MNYSTRKFCKPILVAFNQFRTAHICFEMTHVGVTLHSDAFKRCIHVRVLHFGLLTNIFGTCFQAITSAGMEDRPVNKKDFMQERLESLLNKCGTKEPSTFLTRENLLTLIPEVKSAKRAQKRSTA
ncbi:hypothetical protein TNCV_4370571 [Trichonephila clavipes]|uniref:Uncharacterized protein n=1 Tax=Trichonephila clavipes TaxID=2585209 RepID=A0A8X6SA16_TRICX|nr:hypothetical protein TNCV_4370571 [Trichonephila clavipes]